VDDDPAKSLGTGALRAQLVAAEQQRLQRASPVRRD
jgi:hypothetical protein